ncbi:hypothetical protein RB601_005328 [Gaeumannomyces tritici]
MTLLFWVTWPPQLSRWQLGEIYAVAGRLHPSMLLRLSLLLAIFAWEKAATISSAAGSVAGEALWALPELQVRQCSHAPASMSRIGGIFACPQPMDENSVSLKEPARWAPWTHPPFCADSSFCVYTNAAFQTGRGFSIITTPRVLASAQGQLELAFTAPPLASAMDGTGVDEGMAIGGTRNKNNSADVTPTPRSTHVWEVKNIPGKGKGVVATRRIRRGETIMVDYAMVLAAVEFPGRVTQTQGNKILERAASQLRNPERVLGLGRSSTAGAPVMEDVMRTNTFSVTINGEPYMGLFPSVSRINHACAPNAQTRFSGRTLSQKVVAFLDIEPGDEITISYPEFGMTHKNRQDTLLHRWGFKCTCSLCGAHPREIAASDARRERAVSVRDQIMEHVQSGELSAAIRQSKALIELSIEEGLVSGLGDHYELLARLHMGARDLGGAARYARLALAEMRDFGGGEEFDGFGELELFVAQLDAKGV